MAPLEQRTAVGHNNQSTSTRNMTTPQLSPPLLPLNEPINSRGNASKTVAYAVNYETSLVDRFSGNNAAPRMGIKDDSSNSNDSQAEDNDDDNQSNSHSVRKPSVILDDEEGTNNNNNPSTCTRRRSVRELKQRTVNMTPVKVRYDMDCVPLVDRPKMSFWDDVKVWPPRALKDPPPPILPSPNANATVTRHAAPNFPTPVPTNKPIRPQSPLPNSVIWKPTRRKDWEDSVSELTAVCTSAALRKHTGPPSKFVPPLSREYIRDRIDIDDPLRGYQIRHALGGWLQGFVLWTNFTTWTHDFAWDSLHSKAGLASSPYIKDSNGSLAKELQALHRSGDPSDSGIVFENIAEIALLGGLGCGELLLRMALEDILKCPDHQYKYVVMQATNGSRAFYERFGFRRVGAICRYASDGSSSHPRNTDNAKSGNQNDNPTANNDAVATTTNPAERMSPGQDGAGIAVSSSNPKSPTLDNPIQGYRHWTHHNESQHSLDLHGGPSYMMCLKLPEDPVEGLNLLEKLTSCFVTDKPTIDSVGASTTPISKRKLKRPSSVASFNTPSLPIIGENMVRPQSQSVPPSFMAPGEWNSSKRRKVSMDKLDLGVADPSSAHDYPTTIPSNGFPYPQPEPSFSTPLSSSFKRTTKVYSQPVARGVANTTPSKASAKKLTPPKLRSQVVLATPTPSLNPKKMRSSSTPLPPPIHPDVTANQAIPTKTVQKIDHAILVKQKVKSYPRDREHFFNKVVQPKGRGSNKRGPYYFVLNFNERLSMITLCPMAPMGILSGKRHGRPRYQCALQDTSANWITAPTRLYDPVPAFMVMKTPFVSQEAWDILEDA